MTKEKAIEILTDNWTTIDNSRYSSDELNEAFNIAISALENNYNSAEQTDGDLISRKAVLDIFGDIHPLDYNARAYVAQINELPSAEK